MTHDAHDALPFLVSDAGSREPIGDIRGPRKHVGEMRHVRHASWSADTLPEPAERVTLLRLAGPGTAGQRFPVNTEARLAIQLHGRLKRESAEPGQ
jgi:hypothetical protein